jgi:ribosomal protein L18
MKKQEEDIALAKAVGKLIAQRRQERSWMRISAKPNTDFG